MTLSNLSRRWGNFPSQCTQNSFTACDAAWFKRTNH